MFSPNDEPTPSCGTPSIKTFTCLPLNPSSMTCMSEPTPPVSLIFIPGTFSRASLRFSEEFDNPLVSTTTAL